jgi:ADP-ribose pyrophosphatase YjhB (NUDIX family)
MAGEKIDKVALVCIKDGRVLCTRSGGKDVFYMPGGQREPGETDAQTLVREIKEELSVDLVPSSLKWMGIFEAQAHGKPKGTMVKMLCYAGEFRGTIVPAAEVEEIAWLSYADRNKLSEAGQELFDWLKHWKLLR